MTLDAAFKSAIEALPDCVAGGYVDMTSGMLLSVQTIDAYSHDLLDLMAAATADLFQGPTVTEVERLFRASRDQEEDGRHYFKEIIVLSENLLHIFLRCKVYQDHAVVFVCRSGVTIGMALTKARMALAGIERAL